MKIIKYLFKTKRGQAITIDFISGIIIITIALVIATNLLSDMRFENTFDDVKRKTIEVSELLMQVGFPSDWNATSVIKLGLLSDNQLNKTKLDAVVLMNYSDIKSSLNDVQHVYWYFMNKTAVLNLSRCGFGDPDVLIDASCSPQFPSHKNLISLNRFVAYNNSLLRLVVVSWD